MSPTVFASLYFLQEIHNCLNLKNNFGHWMTFRSINSLQITIIQKYIFRWRCKTKQQIMLSGFNQINGGVSYIVYLLSKKTLLWEKVHKFNNDRTRNLIMVFMGIGLSMRTLKERHLFIGAGCTWRTPKELHLLMWSVIWWATSKEHDLLMSAAMQLWTLNYELHLLIGAGRWRTPKKHQMLMSAGRGWT